jgi:hypothetical protein
MILVAIDIESVVEGQLISRIDVLERVDENFPPLDPRLTIGRTGMIDQPGGIPWHVAINVVLPGKREDIDRRIARFQGLGML